MLFETKRKRALARGSERSQGTRSNQTPVHGGVFAQVQFASMFVLEWQRCIKPTAPCCLFS